MHWEHRDQYIYTCGLWAVQAKDENGILKWAVWKDGKELTTRRNLINAKDYAERQEYENG